MIEPECILHLEQVPIQQNRVYFSHEEAIACPKGDIALVQDPVTGIVHNAAFDGKSMVYDENYQNEQGCSGVFKEHLDQVATTVQRYLGAGSVVEVGCGKGTFLELLRLRGCHVVGVDPAYEGDASYVVRSQFSSSLGLTGDVVVLRHVLEHIPQPLSFLDSVAEANRRAGFIYIEVPCLDWIRENRAWFDIYYEHVNYFRLQDFNRCFSRVIESGRIFGGQYLYAIADLASLQSVSEYGGDQFHFGVGFMAGVDGIISRLDADKSRRVCIWGGASKGVVFAHHLQRGGKLAAEFAIDINPAKQGGFFPGSGLPVLSPEEGLWRLSDGDVVIVMNPNYLNEVRQKTGDRFSYWLVDGIGKSLIS